MLSKTASKIMSVERGIDPGNQVDTSLVELAVGTNPDVIRLNFIDAFDTAVPISTIRKYRAIIKEYRDRGIKVVGLAGGESVGGGYNPTADGFDPEVFGDKLAKAASKIVHFFGNNLEGIEIFNEPNDYMGGDTHQIAPDMMANYLTKVADATKNRPQRRKLNIISGPVFAHDLYDNPWEDSGARYFYDLLWAGYEYYGWAPDHLPFDEAGWHIYVGQGSVDPEIVTNLIDNVLVEIKWALDDFQIGPQISISEVGWQSGIVGELGQSINIETTNNILSADERVSRWLYFCLKDFDNLTFGVTYSDEIKKQSFDTLANLPK